MTVQEKIDQLATAALRAAPPSAAPPVPTTYIAPFGKPKTVALVSTRGSAAESVPAVPFVPATEVEAAPFKDEADPELRAQIEAREVRIRKNHQRKSIAVSFATLAIVGAGSFFCYKSPAVRAEIGALVPALRQSVDDVKMVGSLTKKYDEQLEKIAVHGRHIDEATRAMGVDPTATDAGGNQEFDAEMASMMGGEGQTSGERDRALQAKFGVIGKLADRKPKSAPAADTLP